MSFGDVRALRQGRPCAALKTAPVLSSPRAGAVLFQAANPVAGGFSPEQRCRCATAFSPNNDGYVNAGQG